ncbi:MAG: hypothetical protein ACOC1F_08685 [Myxococcota bacterium]
MSDSEFFREATIQIHRSLDIATAMGRCLPVLQRTMGLFLYDRELATLRLIAHATDEGGERLDRGLGPVMPSPAMPRPAGSAGPPKRAHCRTADPPSTATAKSWT